MYKITDLRSKLLFDEGVLELMRNGVEGS